MSAAPEFALVPLAKLRAHEEIEDEKVDALVAEIRRSGVVADPIWVARGSDVILNGHHRVAALRRLGAERVPAWLLDYDDPSVDLGRWGPGPRITKDEVVRRARAGRLFPPKTTRHTVTPAPPARATALAELGASRAAQAPRSNPSRSRSARTSEPG
jgi:L-serine kinase (ADP)